MKWRVAVVVLAIGAAIAPVPPSVVERYYSSGLFPHLQRRVTAVSNLTSLALLDILIVAAGLWLVWRTVGAIVSSRTIGWRRPALQWLVRVSAAVSIVYLAFLMMWGLNYRRTPLTGRVPFDPSAVSSDAATTLAIRAAGEVNALYRRAHDDPAAVSPDPTLARAFADAQASLGVRLPAHPGRPKQTLLNPYFEAAGVDGMTDPFLLETLIPRELLPFERPFVIAHEWSHLAGFADEGEANFVGWLTCTKGSDAVRYSGWLFLYSQVFAALRSSERTAVAARLDPGPLGDLRAIAQRASRQVKPAVANAGWRVYDRYLKANRVEAGAASYAEVVRLVLGVRLDPA